MNEIKKTQKKKNEKQTTQVAVSNWINYADKVSTIQPEIPNVNLVNANDMNSIKWTVMQGIPLFYKGQVLTFINYEKFELFKSKFNVHPNTFVCTSDFDPEFAYIRSGKFIPDPQRPEQFRVLGEKSFTIQDVNFPIGNYFLENTSIVSQGNLVFHKGTGGNLQGKYPVVTGFWDQMMTETTNQYFIKLNKTQTQAPISLEPRAYELCIVFVNNDVYAKDLL